MKKVLRTIGLSLFASLGFISCDEDDKKSNEAKVLDFQVKIGETDYSVAKKNVAIDHDKKTITIVDIPYGTYIGSLSPKFVLSSGAISNKADNVKMGFTSGEAKTIEVTAEDGTKATYSITLTVKQHPLIGTWKASDETKDITVVLDFKADNTLLTTKSGADLTETSGSETVPVIIKITMSWKTEDVKLTTTGITEETLKASDNSKFKADEDISAVINILTYEVEGNKLNLTPKGSSTKLVYTKQ